MRHIYAYRFTYLIAALLVLAAMLFAWLRSAERPAEAETGATPAAAFAVASPAQPSALMGGATPWTGGGDQAA
jgi:hypothetical protein